MGRINKFTSGVFTNIVGDQKSISLYDQFQEIQKELKDPSVDLCKFLQMYKKTIEKNKTSFELLANLEDVIMQIRMCENLTPHDIKLNVVREYIYARVPFYRKDKTAKDIRIIVGKTKVWGKNLKKLLGNEEFVNDAMDKLTSAMKEMIKESASLVNIPH